MKKKKRPLFGQNGVVTVFVAMMLVPVVVFTSTMTDIARFKLFASQASMMADTYGETVLSGYDNLLKDLYGLFSVTQDQAALDELKTYADYVGYSFDTGAQDAHAPYAEADYEIGYETIKGANLANNSVLMTQIGDFMKFRVVETFMNDLGQLDFGAFFQTLDSMKNINKDNEAFQKVSEIGECSLDVLEKMRQYYETLINIKRYPTYISGEENHVHNFSNTMKAIIAEPGYSDYVFYLDHKAEIESAISKAEANRKAAAEDKDPPYTLSETEKEYVSKYGSYDANAYKNGLKNRLDPLSNTAYETKNSSSLIDTSNAEKTIKDLQKNASDIENAIDDVVRKRAQAQAAIANASAETKEALMKEIETLDKIVELDGKFTGLSNNSQMISNIERNKYNKEVIEHAVKGPATYVLNDIKDEIINGSWTPNDGNWTVTLDTDWWDFYTVAEYKQFYDEMGQLYGSVQGSGDKSKADDYQNRANNKADTELSKISGAETTTARSIGSLSSQLDGASGQEIPGIMSMFKNGMSFGKAAATAVTTVANDIMLVQYDFGMFSNRVTGMEKKDSDPRSSSATTTTTNTNTSGSNTGTQSTTQDDNAEYSLTNYKKSKNINYLYGAEIEYLIGGRTNSAKNLEYTRNFICAFRMTMNMISTYTITEVNTAINGIADAAAAAVASTVFGAAAAPLVRIAVSLALRLGVASMETVADWNKLKDRDKVMLYKTKVGDLSSTDISSFLGGFDGNKSFGSGEGSGGLKLGYEDYIKVLLYLLVDQNTLLDRTSDLIALNVNQAEQKADTLTTLNFKMSKTMTAITSYCKAHIDMVVISDNFLEQAYADDTEGTKEKIEAIDDGYIKYSVIRGY